MSAVYRWKPQVVAKIDAQVAGDEIDRIKSGKNGLLEPIDLVNAARDEASPLHPAFEWDDPAAAEAYRVQQASYLIRSIEIVTIRPDEAPTSIRAFVNVERGEDRGYTTTFDALSDPDLRQQVLKGAWRELEAWRARHAELIEFARVFSAIDQAREA